MHVRWLQHASRAKAVVRSFECLAVRVARHSLYDCARAALPTNAFAKCVQAAATNDAMVVNFQLLVSYAPLVIAASNSLPGGRFHIGCNVGLLHGMKMELGTSA
jgi:hypothetical protein